MKAERAADVEALIREIRRYLQFVDAIRMSNRPAKRRGGEGSTK